MLPCVPDHEATYGYAAEGCGAAIPTTVFRGKTEVFALLYAFVSVSFCVIVHSYNGMLFSMLYAMFLLFRRDRHCSVFMLLQITSIVLFFTANHLYANVTDPTQTHLLDDAAYRELAMRSRSGFSFAQIFYRDVAERNVYRVFPELLPQYSWAYIIENLGYDYLLGIITAYFFVFPLSSVDYMFVNAIPALGLIILVKRVASRYYNKGTAEMAASLLMFYPSFVAHSFFLLKDIWVAFFVFWFVSAVVGSSYCRAAVAASLVVIFRLKLAFALPVMAYFRKRSRLRWVTIGVVSFLAAGLYFNVYDMLRYAVVVDKAGLTGEVFRLPLVLRYPGFAILLMFSHFPPIHTALYDFNASYIFYDLGSLYWILLIPYLLIGVYISVRRDLGRPVWVAFAVLSCGLVLTGWIDLRWRLMLEPFAFCLTAMGICRGGRYTNTALLLYCGILVFACAYILTKQIL